MTMSDKPKGWPRQVPETWREVYLPKDLTVFCYFERYVGPLRLVVSSPGFAGWHSSLWHGDSLWDRSEGNGTALAAIRKAESAARKAGYRP